MPLRRWTPEGLASALESSQIEFEQSRLASVERRVENRFQRAAANLEDVFRATDDLRNLEGAFSATEWRSAPHTLRAFDVLRLVTMPPIGRDELGPGTRARRSWWQSADQIERFEQALPRRIDRHRFPWIDEGRVPTDCERQIAIVATASIAVAQSLPIINRQAVEDQARGFERQLRESGWERLPDEVPLHHLPPNTYVRRRRAERVGYDYTLRLSTGELALVEVKVSVSATGRPPSWVRAVGRPSSLDIPHERVLVLYGAAPVSAMLDLQERGTWIVPGSAVAEFLSREPAELTYGPADEPVMRSPGTTDLLVAWGEPRPELAAPGREVGGAHQSPSTVLDIAESTIRLAADLVHTNLGAGSRIGRLGRRKAQSPEDGYLGQYVHFGSSEEPLAVWLYFAEAGHPYSVAGFPAGYWIGLKHDAARELSQEWAPRVEPDMTWLQQIDVRWSGFRHFFEGLTTDSPPAEAAETMANWATDFIARHELMPVA